MKNGKMSAIIRKDGKFGFCKYVINESKYG